MGFSWSCSVMLDGNCGEQWANITFCEESSFFGGGGCVVRIVLVRWMQ